MGKRPGHHYETAQHVGIDFGVDTPLDEAALYEEPFEYVRSTSSRCEKESSKKYPEVWWLSCETAPGMRRALAKLIALYSNTRVCQASVFRLAR